MSTDPDAYLAMIPEQERRHWRLLHSQCQRCGNKVGSANLGVCIWPVPPRTYGNNKISDSGRYGLGRIRLCGSCIAETKASVRVPAPSIGKPAAKGPQPASYAQRRAIASKKGLTKGGFVT
jgi:hypothetical protein